MSITDRIRFTIIQVNTNEIISRDLVVQDPEVMLNLSAPSRCTFKVSQGEQTSSAYGIDWQTWRYWIVPEIEIDGTRYCLSAQILSKCDIDPKTGDMICEGLGFMGYPKGIPWLTNYNPIAVDPAEVVQKVWSDCQNYTNANLGVEVLPALTGTQMLPGFSFDGNALNFDFFAMFVRETDFQDSGDVISALARDIPLDMIEIAQWNSDRTSLGKYIYLGYPQVGYKQYGLGFIHGENVITAECADELEIEPVSDIIIRSWRPGKAYSARLNIEQLSAELGYTVANPLNRLRRVMMEEDAHINSTERAKAWAKRRLTRRNIPRSFKKIIVDSSHPNAPIGTYNVGDSIYVEARNYPWYGDIGEWHRITSITIKGNEPLIEIGLKVEGAFNYDPIEYNTNYDTQPTADLNRLSNGYFNNTLTGWKRNAGSWIYTKAEGYASPGCVYVLCSPAGNRALESHRVSINPGQSMNISAWVRRESIVAASGINVAVDGIYVQVKGYKNGGAVFTARMNGLPIVAGTGPWTQIAGSYTAPSNSSIDEISVVLASSQLTSGTMYWDDVRVIPV